MAARYPFAGSAYIFAYIRLGEFPAYLIGWDLSLEYLVAVSAVSRGFASYIASIVEGFGGVMPQWLYNWDVGDGWYFSPLSCLICIIIFAVVLIGAKGGAILNIVITVVSLLTLLFFIICGAVFANPAFWRPFAPFGGQGVFAGAATLFFSYVGFDAITSLR